MGNFFTSLFAPLTAAMSWVLTEIHSVVPSYGWSLIILALVVRLALWPLAQTQFKSMAEMQKLQPLTKALQAKYKGDTQRIQTETMALYKEHNVNPLAGCLPLLVQLPILIALYNAIQIRKDAFSHEGFAWIGSPLSHQFPAVFATNLGQSDLILLALYMISMYLSVRFGSPPSSDPQQAQTQKIMAFVSPAMIGFLGFRNHWASALILYWLFISIFTMAQQLFLYRRYGLIGPRAAVTPAVPPPELPPPPNAGSTKKARDRDSELPPPPNAGSTKKARDRDSAKVRRSLKG